MIILKPKLALILKWSIFAVSSKEYNLKKVDFLQKSHRIQTGQTWDQLSTFTGNNDTFSSECSRFMSLTETVIKEDKKLKNLFSKEFSSGRSSLILFIPLSQKYFIYDFDTNVAALESMWKCHVEELPDPIFFDVDLLYDCF